MENEDRGAAELTIVVPVYNELGNMGLLESSLSSYVSRCPRRACVLFVDDGSTDGSGEAIEGLCRAHAPFHYVRFAANRGLSAALKAGIDWTETPLVGYIDADLQTYPEDFDLLLARIDEADLVSGVRARRQDGVGKRLQSRVANAFRRLMTGDRATDTGCPLKVMRTAVARRVPFFTGMHRFLPALVGLQAGARFVEVPVRHRPRQAGKSKFSLANRLWGPLNDCFAFRWMRKRYINYDVLSTDLA